MSIGKMRQLLQIQRFTSTPDGGGGSTVVFSKVADVFAQILPKDAQESLFGDQMREVTSHVIMIRYRRDLSHADRLVQNHTRNGELFSRTFAIKGIKNINNEFKYMQIAAQEGAGVPT
jgi:SPP1 family predicted phage head-tail adaptor